MLDGSLRLCGSGAFPPSPSQVLPPPAVPAGNRAQSPGPSLKTPPPSDPASNCCLPGFYLAPLCPLRPLEPFLALTTPPWLKPSSQNARLWETPFVPLSGPVPLDRRLAFLRGATPTHFPVSFRVPLVKIRPLHSLRAGPTRPWQFGAREGDVRLLAPQGSRQGRGCPMDFLTWQGVAAAVTLRGALPPDRPLGFPGMEPQLSVGFCGERCGKTLEPPSVTVRWS